MKLHYFTCNARLTYLNVFKLFFSNVFTGATLCYRGYFLYSPYLSIEAAKRIELVLAWALLSTYPTLYFKDIRVG